ncbi:MAG: CRISPR-associated endonuclease Cas3'', partial [Desulfobacteraceae bacterium]
MGRKKYYAHSKEGCPPEEWQLLEEHLALVAKKASEFAAKFDSADWAWNAGWLHDVGKAADEFQAYLLRENGMDDFEYDLSGKGRVNHSGAGAAFAEEKFGSIIGLSLSYIAAGHHAGLPDWFTSDTGNAALTVRLEEGKHNLKAVYETTREFTNQIKPLHKPPAFVKPANYHFWVRMLYSCLVDADFLDTEAFMQPEKSGQRVGFPSLQVMKRVFDSHMEQFTATTPVNKIRFEILAACRSAAKQSPGFFSLTVPTGGGKTLSSMAFALDHALKYGKDRIIYVIPYTSIIEQTAQIFGRIFGPENVIEHHSNLDPEKETQRSRLASENWDAPVIVTTNVQFFESLFAAKPSRCRKLHHIINSVIIFDEAQLLPPEWLDPCTEAMNELARHLGATILLA